MAIDGCSLPALHSAVRRIIRGEVEEHNGKFIPSTAILSRVVRYEDDVIRIKASHANRKQIERQQYENVVELDDATKKRRLAQLQELTSKLQKMSS